MPRYFFQVHDGHSLPDRDGTELPDLHSAQVEAVRYSGDLLSSHAADFWNGRSWFLEVTNADGAVLFTLRFEADFGDRGG